MDRSDLLKELRIDRDVRPARSRARWLAVAGVALLLVGAALWLGLGRVSTPAVRTAVARAATAETGGGSVLDASGYVTARRQATVSSKITGRSSRCSSRRASAWRRARCWRGSTP